MTAPYLIADFAIMTSTLNYTNQPMNDLWNDIAPGYYNYGRISPDADLDKIPDLKQANEDMVQWLVAKLGINKNSHVLDLACGKGMYTVRIAEITGCRYTGVDRMDSYIENECKKWAKEHGVSDQGEFLVGSITDLPSEVKEKSYTHVLCLGAMFYVHEYLDDFLENAASCCNKDTKVFIWDFVCNIPWSEQVDLQRHLKMDYPIRSKEHVLGKFKSSRLELVECGDHTPYIVPGYKVMERECRKRDPELKVLTYPLMGKTLEIGTLSYLTYLLKLQ